MTARVLGPAVLLAAAVAGLSWAPTFPLTALALPVLLPLAAVLVVDQLCLGRGWTGLRPLLGLVVGAAVLVLVFRLVDGAGAAEVLRGVTGGWRRTLGSTLPALPDPDVVAFVPALALLAGVLGLEWGRRGAGPAGTLLPALGVVVLGQLFHAATGTDAVLTALAVGGAAVVVLLADRRVRPARIAALAPQLLGTLAVAGLAAWGATAVGVPGRPTVTLQDGRSADSGPLTAADPLSEIAPRLVAGDRPAFTARAGASVDRWPLVVLDRFDGVTWSSDARLLRLGVELPAPAVSVPVTAAEAEITDVALDGPWLPSQERLRAADGIRPLVDPATGVLVRGRDAPAAVPSYVLHWAQVRIDAAGLTSSAIDPEPIGAVELDGIPAGFADLAHQAVGPDAAPTVSAALVLEKWMQQNYQVVSGADLPTGHSTAQLLHFLTTSKKGTSEQFAPAYALMARSLGIPVRVVVGFRDDGSGRVRDADVLAWPEIAVQGIGWVPLDPTGGAQNSTARGDDLAGATQAARRELPSADQLAARQPGEPPPPALAPAAPGRAALPLWPFGVAVLLAVAVVPVTKSARRLRRRRSPPRAAVVNAWRDTRDVLGDHGVAIPTGSTVRELAAVAPVDARDVDALARSVDGALWTGREPDPALAAQAWAAADRIRRALRALPWQRRLRAAFAVGSLRPARQQLAPRTG